MVSSRIHEASSCIWNIVPASSFTISSQVPLLGTREIHSILWVAPWQSRDSRRDCGCGEDSSVLFLQNARRQKRKMVQCSRCKGWFLSEDTSPSAVLESVFVCTLCVWWLHSGSSLIILWLWFSYTLTNTWALIACISACALYTNRISNFRSAISKSRKFLKCAEHVAINTCWDTKDMDQVHLGDRGEAQGLEV